MRLLVINGPNLNLLGMREPQIYGTTTYPELCSYIKDIAKRENLDIDIIQSNHEGVLVDAIQDAHGNADGIVINPAAYTHTSIAILDALKAVGIPAVEIHLSDPSKREDFRHISYAGAACVKTFAGLGVSGYKQAILYIKQYIRANGSEEKKG